MAFRKTGLLAVTLWLAMMAGCSPSDRIKRMSDAEMLEALRQPDNEPYHVWYGMLSGSIEKDNCGWVGPAPIAIVPKSFLIWGRQEIRERLERDPGLFLPLLDPDPQYNPLPADRVILAFYLYSDCGSTFWPGDPQAKAGIAPAFRRMLTHPDLRARYVAARWLINNKELEPADWKTMLRDQNSLLRYEAATYSDKLNRTSEWWAGLLDHLNDPHWAVRSALAGNLYRYSDGPGMAKTERSFDWVRAGWQEREDMRGAWRKWATQNALLLETGGSAGIRVSGGSVSGGTP